MPNTQSVSFDHSYRGGRRSPAKPNWFSRIVSFPATKGDTRSILAFNVQALSLFRIVFCIYLAYNFFFNVYPWYDDFYGDAGILPMTALAGHNDFDGLAVMVPLLSFFDPLRIPGAYPVLFATTLLCFAIGYKTRLANAVLFVLTTYLYWRNPFVLSGAEDLAHFSLLWSLFLPMNRHWSVDSALDPQPPDRPYPAIPFVAIRLQIVSLYFVSGLFKLEGAPWRSGNAILWALSDTAYGSTPLGLFLVDHVPGVLYLVNYAVIVFQLAFPFLVYCPWRNDWTRGFALLGAACMHTSFIFCLSIGSFPYMSLTVLLLMVPDAWIDLLLKKRRMRLSQVGLYYETGCEHCRRFLLVLREFLLPRAAKLLPASHNPEASRALRRGSWAIRMADGSMKSGWTALTYVLRQNVIFVPLAWLLSVRFVQNGLEWFYSLFARASLGRLAMRALPVRRHGVVPVPALVICTFLSALALASNVSSLTDPMDDDSSTWVDRAAAVLQVQQRWRLFAPVPSHVLWHFAIVVHKDDGTTTDFMRLLKTPTFDTSTGKVLSGSHLWLKYYTRYYILHAEDWDALGSYLCRKSQASVGPSSGVNSVDVKVSTQNAISGNVNPPLEVDFDCRAGAG